MSNLCALAEEIKYRAECAEAARDRLLALLDPLRDMAQQVATQDNAITANPIFMVQRCVRNHGIDPSCTDHTVWVSSDGDEADPELCAALEDLDDGYGRSWTDEERER